MSGLTKTLNLTFKEEDHRMIFEKKLEYQARMKKEITWAEFMVLAVKQLKIEKQ